MLEKEENAGIPYLKKSKIPSPSIGNVAFYLNIPLKFRHSAHAIQVVSGKCLETKDAEKERRDERKKKRPSSS